MTIADPTRSRHAIAGETTDDYRWVVLAVTSIGALLASLTSGTLVIALPDMTALHVAFGVGAVACLIGAVVSALRGPHVVDEPETGAPRGRAVVA